MKPFLQEVGNYGVSQAQDRLTRVLEPGGIRSGDLTASQTVFEVTGAEVRWGSNKRYAAQVNYGGTIRPIPPKQALAIPIPDRLKRSGIGPGKADPQREILTFIPSTGGAKGNVIGLLVDEEGLFGGGKGQALYILAREVTQQARPHLFLDDEDVEEIEILFSDFIELTE
jgi:phage gpG-like protein